MKELKTKFDEEERKIIDLKHKNEELSDLLFEILISAGFKDKAAKLRDIVDNNKFSEFKKLNI